jgi:hypothetical protein
LALLYLLNTDVVQFEESRRAFLNALVIEQKVALFAKNAHIVGICLASLTPFDVALALSHVHPFDIIQVASFSHGFQLEIRRAIQ